MISTQDTAVNKTADPPALVLNAPFIDKPVWGLPPGSAFLMPLAGKIVVKSQTCPQELHTILMNKYTGITKKLPPHSNQKSQLPGRLAARALSQAQEPSWHPPLRSLFPCVGLLLPPPSPLLLLLLLFLSGTEPGQACDTPVWPGLLLAQGSRRGNPASGCRVVKPGAGSGWRYWGSQGQVQGDNCRGSETSWGARDPELTTHVLPGIFFCAQIFDYEVPCSCRREGRYSLLPQQKLCY